MNYTISWWNLENCLAPNTAARSSKLQKRHRKTLAHWSEAVYTQKLTRLSQCITQFHDGSGPDILGVGEIDSQETLDALTEQLNQHYTDPKQHYRNQLGETADPRRMHVALLYRAAKLTLSQTQHYFIASCKKTRHILAVECTTSTGAQFSILANHWPSKRNPDKDRIKAAKTLRSALSESTNPTVIIGDFNNIFNPQSAIFRPLFETDLIEPLFSDKKPTYYHQGPDGIYGLALDYAFANKALTQHADWQVSPIFVESGHQNELGQPTRFTHIDEKSFNLDTGASDHFAISLTLTAK